MSSIRARIVRLSIHEGPVRGAIGCAKAKTEPSRSRGIRLASPAPVLSLRVQTSRPEASMSSRSSSSGTLSALQKNSRKIGHLVRFHLVTAWGPVSPAWPTKLRWPQHHTPLWSSFGLAIPTSTADLTFPFPCFWISASGPAGIRDSQRAKPADAPLEGSGVTSIVLWIRCSAGFQRLADVDGHNLYTIDEQPAELRPQFAHFGQRGTENEKQRPGPFRSRAFYFRFRTVALRWVCTVFP